MSLEALQDAINKFETQTKFAEAVGKTQGHVTKWVQRKKVPAAMVLIIEAKTGVARHRLRPDLYPPPSSTAPTENQAVA